MDRITNYYKELGQTTDEEKRASIQKVINEESLLAAKYAIPNELDQMLASIGATNVNAFTSEDMTVYHNSFPSNQMNRWLELYSSRFENPVFRLFQSELETVYEEKNRANDNFGTNLFNTFNKKFWKVHPYGQQTILGETEHLKNPPLHTMYEYFYEYYVPNNMALIISGDFDTEKIIPVIEEKFGDWKAKPVKEYPDYKEEDFKQREFYEVKMSPVKMGILGFRAPGFGHEDNPGITVINNLLSNSEGSGYIDALTNDGKILGAESFNILYNDYSANSIFFAPKLIGQKLEEAENLVLDAINKVKTGEFTEEQLQAVKLNLLIDYESNWENNEERVYQLATCFSSGLPWSTVIQYKSQIESLTKEQIVALANKYYGDNYLVLHSRMGFPKKEKLKKPEFEPVVSKNEVKSEFAEHFHKLPQQQFTPNFVEFKKEVQKADITSLVHLKTSNNPYNDVFSLKIEFGIGQNDLPSLFYFNQLSPYPATKEWNATAFNNKFYELGSSITCRVTLDRLSIELSGLDKNFEASVELLNKYLTEFSADESIIKKVKEDLKAERKFSRNEPTELSNALSEYVLYGDQSKYLIQFDKKKEKSLTASDLLNSFKEAQKYEADITYTGTLPLSKVANSLKDKLPLDQISNKAKPNLYRTRKKADKTIIYFVNDKKAVQSQIKFYIEGKPFKKEHTPQVDAFNHYFGADMSSLVFQEIREFRSLAYSARAFYVTPKKENYNGLFFGYIGCQGDKTKESVGTMLSLINNMPEKTNRIDNIRTSLVQQAQSSRPNFRNLIGQVNRWEKLGYKEDPNKLKIKEYKSLQFNDITRFNQELMKDKPIIITIIGNAKKFNPKELSSFGTLIKLNKKQLYNN